MPSITFSPGTVIPSTWLNDVNTSVFTTVPNIISGVTPVALAVAATTATTASSVTNGVYTIGAQTIAGVKTFSSSPVVPTPTNATDAANKTYVDGIVTGYQRIQQFTSVASSGQTSLEFLTIPSWTKKITVILAAVSTNGSTNPSIQIGSSSYTTSGYAGAQAILNTSGATGNYSTGFSIGGGSASNSRSGVITLAMLKANIWVISGTLGFSDGTNVSILGGHVTIGGTLDRLRVYAGGTDTFDNGEVNIIVEG